LGFSVLGSGPKKRELLESYEFEDELAATLACNGKRFKKQAQFEKSLKRSVFALKGHMREYAIVSLILRILK
jgi:hypothetical protein